MTSIVLTDFDAALLWALIGDLEVADIADFVLTPYRVSSTSGPSEQPLILRFRVFLYMILPNQQKTSGEVLLSRGFSELQRRAR